MQEYRYELKFIISEDIGDYLKHQLAMIMDLDKHSVSDKYSYHIRSLYFDDPYSTALFDKLASQEYRQKYRIRMYNFTPQPLVLECKHKDLYFTFKEGHPISMDTYQAIMSRDFMAIRDPDPFLKRFTTACTSQPLIPSTIVDYTRLAFVYPLSDIRITFDQDIRSGRYSTDMLDQHIPTFAAIDTGTLVLEVKCNEYIPDHILSILESVPLCRRAVSKFAQCRIRGEIY